MDGTNPVAALRSDLDGLLSFALQVQESSYSIDISKRSGGHPEDDDFRLASRIEQPRAESARDWSVILWRSSRALTGMCVYLDGCEKSLDSLPPELVDDPADPPLKRWKYRLRRHLVEMRDRLGDIVRDGRPVLALFYFSQLLDFSEINQRLWEFAKDLDAIAPPPEPSSSVPQISFVNAGFKYLGNVYELGGKPLEVLRSIAEAGDAGRSSTELHSRHWKNRPVTDDAIRVNVSSARAALRTAIQKCTGAGTYKGDPLPVVSKGDGRTAWKLSLPRSS